MVFIKSYASDDPMEFMTSELHPNYAINVTYDIFLNFKLDQALRDIPKLFFFDVSTHPPTCLDTTGFLNFLESRPFQTVFKTLRS
jgi:hypothetical protein